jgi:hypothetical protein
MPLFKSDISVAETDGAVDSALQDCGPRLHMLLLQLWCEFSVFGRIGATDFTQAVMLLTSVWEVPGLNLGWASNYSRGE